MVPRLVEIAGYNSDTLNLTTCQALFLIYRNEVIGDRYGIMLVLVANVSLDITHTKPASIPVFAGNNKFPAN